MTRLHLVVSGRVQGVWFRASTQRQARSLGLVGEVWNRADGAVEIIAEGPAADLAQLEQWARGGPPGARVDHCLSCSLPATGAYADFSISA